MNWTIFKPPYETNARAGSKTRIWPVFLPFKGCVNRCIYCSQHVLTGVGASDLNSIFNTLVTDLEQALAANVTPLEMAFFGSTFTNLPKMWIFKFLDLAQEYRKKGLITRIRCSTRPDSFDLSLLTELRAQGMDLVELGIQSFTDEILTAAKRGYTGREAEEACRMVRESGLTLGIQLMPGLIGDRPGYFQCDVRRAMAQAPECVRLYPCLALKGTKLAKIWHEGGFRPWSLARAVDELTRAYMAFRHGGISVIRMGLAQEPGLEKIIAAGSS